MLNIIDFESSLQTKLDNVISNAESKEFLLLAKAAEALKTGLVSAYPNIGQRPAATLETAGRVALVANDAIYYSDGTQWIKIGSSVSEAQLAASAVQPAALAAAIAGLVDSAPGTLDTLNELAAALADDPNFATTINAQIGAKVSKSGDTMTGDLNLNSNKVTNLATPTANGDAVNKQYIDTLYGSTAAAATSASQAATSATTSATFAGSATTSATNAANSATAAATSATNAASSATSASNSASSASTSATSADTAATTAVSANTSAQLAKNDAQTSATSASTSATNAASSASTASTNATNAASSATAAASSATSASNSASSASTSATNAAASATAAASSASSISATAASVTATYDLFDDRFLGAKSSDPTVDNDGNALVAGTLVFNTTESASKVWDGSAWQPIGKLDFDIVAVTSLPINPDSGTLYLVTGGA